MRRFWRYYSFVFSTFNDQFKKLYQTLERLFHQVSKHYFSVFGSSDETFFLVFVIFLQTPLCIPVFTSERILPHHKSERHIVFAFDKFGRIYTCIKEPLMCTFLNACTSIVSVVQGAWFSNCGKRTADIYKVPGYEAARSHRGHC